MKKIKENGIGIGGIISILLGCLTGFAIMMHLLTATDGEIDLDGIRFIIFILMYFAATFINVIIHEGGHLIFGLLTGYKFLSFRIFSTVWVKHEGKILRKKYNIAGTAGQCLMWPPEYNDGDFSYVLMNLGGGLMNIIISTLLLFVSGRLPKDGYLWLMSIITAYCGYLAAATNLIPMRMNGLPNDGKNALMMKADPHFREIFWKELYINACLTTGVPYDALDSWLYNTDGVGTDDLHSVYIHAVNGDICMSKGEYEKALEIFDNILENPLVNESVSGLSMLREKIFIMMLLGYDKAEINGLISKKLKNYMKQMAILPSTRRTEYAIELYLNENIQNALKKETAFEDSLKNSPYVSVDVLEKQLFSSFKEKYFAKYSESDYNVS
ncbi:MAG: M50 family metallopeptidase [Eubacteriaceae bacterium]|nr:M50 family metallopeptidase [Eubacteriaceae bacterium]